MSRLHVALGIVLCVGVTTLAAAQDPFNGTWQLNTAKSKYDPSPAPDKATVTIKSDGTTWTVRTTASYEGKPLETSYTVKLDGTPAPLAGSPVADMVSVKKAGDRNVEIKSMKDGKPVGESRATVSADGKTATVTGTGMTPKGEKTKFTAVYEKH
jgi:uncharacterized Zn-binding protein involved in type VI secretion